MDLSELDTAIERYSIKLAVLETAVTTHPSTQQILDVLMARDQVHAALIHKTQTSTENLMKVILLDERLKKQAGLITQLVFLADWRSSLNPPTEAWWWFFEPSTNKWDKFDWLWSALSIASLTASLSLVIDISTRFLTGVPDTLGAFTITTQSVLTLLAAGGALTKPGQEGIEYILNSLKISKYFHNEVKCGFALVLLLSLMTFRSSLPKIAIFYKTEGQKEHDLGRLANAQLKYSRAIKLNPDDWETHYNLGQLYQKLQDFDRARAEYQIAVQGDFKEAYNNLARLYILDKKYPAAINLLLEAQRRTKDKELRYLLLKNLGWARLEQKRYQDAQTYLQDAIDLVNDKPAAHCLIAQVLDQQNEKKYAEAEWYKCLRYATNYNPDEDAWIGMAQQRLKPKKSLVVKGDK